MSAFAKGAVRRRILDTINGCIVDGDTLDERMAYINDPHDHSLIGHTIDKAIADYATVILYQNGAIVFDNNLRRFLINDECDDTYLLDLAYHYFGDFVPTTTDAANAEASKTCEVSGQSNPASEAGRLCCQVEGSEDHASCSGAGGETALIRLDKAFTSFLPRIGPYSI